MPRPCRTSDSTIDIRTKQVVIKSTAGARLATPNMTAAESALSSDRVPSSWVSIPDAADLVSLAVVLDEPGWAGSSAA